MDISERGIDLQVAWEDFRATKYPDGDNGRYSIGHGTHIDTAAEQYLLNATITRQQARNLLLNDNRKQFIPAIQRYIKVPLTQNQLDGLLDLVYNVGPGCLFTGGKTTGLTNAINARNQALIVQKIRAYNKVRKNGVVTTNSYQTRRREADVQMFLYGKILKPNGTVINPTTQQGTTIVDTDSISTVQWVLGSIILLGGGILAYKKGVFKGFALKKLFKSN
jgi:GH24 family phage-related lysozyme (muramidase)